MPIINGSYVNDSLPSPKDAQNAVFGGYTKKDMNDYSTAAYNYLMKQQEQAFNLQLWQLNNEYNTPESQMKRFQDAGLNPNLIYGQSNEAPAPASASATQFRPQNLQQKETANAISTIGQIMNTVKAARETYDYIKYGREMSAWERNLTMERSQHQALQNYWDSYLLGLNYTDPEVSPIPNSPRATMYRYQMDTQHKRYEQLRAICSMIPDQQQRQQSLKALDDYRLQILQGQYDAILQINTGSSGVDAFLRMLGMYLLGK